MKVRIDRDLCIGCGVCTQMCPEVFEMDSENIAKVQENANPDDHAQAVKDAADACPVEAIIVEE